MNKDFFRVGDTVRIREWDDMEREFGLRGRDGLACSLCFLEEMRRFCGREATISHITTNGIVTLKGVDGENLFFNGWSIHTDMLTLVKSAEKTKKVSADAFDALLKKAESAFDDVLSALKEAREEIGD